MAIREQLGQRLLFAFQGKISLPEQFLTALKKYRPAGITLFRSFNIDDPAQLRELIFSLRQAALKMELPPLFIGIDQEGGQLMALGDGTPLPGNMALGATRDSGLAFKAGQVIGAEMAAIGVNVVYAPCADVNSNPLNPVVGTRSFGDDPDLVSEMTAALIKGIQSCGVAATVKHFPGHGDTSTDSHHKLSLLPHSIEHLQKVELPPFRAAIKADVKMLMTAHLGIQAIDGPDSPPATLSQNVVGGLLREEMGYGGVVVTDAMDMHAIQQGNALGGEVVKAACAGVDLIMITSNPLDQQRAFEALDEAFKQHQLDQVQLAASLTRISDLKNWLAENHHPQSLQVIRSFEHMQIADEIAERSITLLKNEGILPLKPALDQHLAVVVPVPQDLTPADTSSYTKPALAEAIRQFHPRVDEFTVSLAPTEDEVTRLLENLRGYDLLVVGTINAYTQPAQKAMVDRILDLKIPSVLVTMRLPYDAAIFPQVSTLLCTYGIQEPSMQAAAKVIFGNLEAGGVLPVIMPDILHLSQ